MYSLHGLINKQFNLSIVSLLSTINKSIKRQPRLGCVSQLKSLRRISAQQQQSNIELVIKVNIVRQNDTHTHTQKHLHMHVHIVIKCTYKLHAGQDSINNAHTPCCTAQLMTANMSSRFQLYCCLAMRMRP